VKVEVEIIDPDTLTDNASIRRLDTEALSMTQRVQLHGGNTKTHLGMEHSWERLEVEEENQENKPTDVFADHGLMRSHMLKVE
jgi:hypothetical protein